MNFKNETNHNRSNSKPVISIRCFPELKYQLAENAQDLGITLSEYCENILNHAEKINDENKKLKMKIADESSKLLNTVEQLESQKNNHIKKLKEINILTEQLQNENKTLKKMTEIFAHPKLEWLFNKVKGQRDIINTSDGKQHNIYYETKSDLIEAMLHSFRFKK